MIKKIIRKSTKFTNILFKQLLKIYQKYQCIENQCYVFVKRLPVTPTLPYIQNGLRIICSFILGLLRYSLCNLIKYSRGGSRTAATSKMEHFVIIVNGFQPLTIITKYSILDVAAVLDPPLYSISIFNDYNLNKLINYVLVFRL